MSPELQLPAHNWLKLRYWACNTLEYTEGSMSQHRAIAQFKFTGVSGGSNRFAGEERMCHICSQIVGDNLQG